MDIDNLSPIFFPSESDIDKDLFVPVAEKSHALDCMVGYFTSGMLSELSLSLSSYLNTQPASPMRFIVSPELSKADLTAIEEAYNSGQSYFDILFPNEVIYENVLAKHTIAALAYLITTGKIELKIAVKRNGLFHIKSWLFRTSKGIVAVHGSSNATKSGLLDNFEQLVINREWLSEESRQICSLLQEKFDSIWSSSYKDIFTIQLNKETLSDIKKMSTEHRDPVSAFMKYKMESKYQPPQDLGETSSDINVPEYINYTSGKFSHQGEAVEAWLENEKNGILSIATGGGKTFVALIAAAKLRSKDYKLLIVIAVPTKALIDQWERDVREFGIVPNNTSGKPSRQIEKEYNWARRKLRSGVSKVEVLIVTQNALLTGLFNNEDESPTEFSMFLIADEVHNLGSEGAQSKLPMIFDFKMGLSATHERQFDQVGTDFILKRFGGLVYEYGLKDAIGECLCEYSYFTNFVYLTAEEEEEFQNFTAEIKKLAYAINSDPNSPARKRWEMLCIERRKLVESAENKITSFAKSLPRKREDISKSIVFCSDKDPRQLDLVNNELNNRRVKFHQITAAETADGRNAQDLISRFSSGELQVLTAKKVLDEGINVPQTENAYFLASNTVRRQWTQRLGRVLRLSPATGKKFANIYDFVVIPQVDSNPDEDLKSLIESEYQRVEFFSKYSSNYMDPDGGYNSTQKLLKILGLI